MSSNDPRPLSRLEDYEEYFKGWEITCTEYTSKPGSTKRSRDRSFYRQKAWPTSPDDKEFLPPDFLEPQSSIPPCHPGGERGHSVASYMAARANIGDHQLPEPINTHQSVLQVPAPVAPKSSQVHPDVLCWTCGTQGHYSIQCPLNQNCGARKPKYPFRPKKEIFQEAKNKLLQCKGEHANCDGVGHCTNECRAFLNPNVLCWNCGQQGHVASGCSQPKATGAINPRRPTSNASRGAMNLVSKQPTLVVPDKSLVPPQTKKQVMRNVEEFPLQSSGVFLGCDEAIPYSENFLVGSRIDYHQYNQQEITFLPPYQGCMLSSALRPREDFPQAQFPQESSESSQRKVNPDIVCWKCHQRGHISTVCLQKKKAGPHSSSEKSTASPSAQRNAKRACVKRVPPRTVQETHCNSLG